MQAQQLNRDKNAYGERNELLEECKTRLERENLDHMENIRRVSAMNSQVCCNGDASSVCTKVEQRLYLVMTLIAGWHSCGMSSSRRMWR